MKQKTRNDKKTQVNKTQKIKTKPNSSFWWVITLAIVVLLGTFFALTQRRSVSAEKLSLEISVAKAHEYYSSGTLMLDVREPEEYESGHIPGSLLIPLGELPDRLSELARDEPIVVVCRSGNRSTTGRDILKRAGYEEVTSMAGGMNQWKQLGYEIEFGAKP